MAESSRVERETSEMDIRSKWLNSKDPREMLKFLREEKSGKLVDQLYDRKLRLFGVACLRNPEFYDLLKDEPSRKSLDVVELYADGKVTWKDLSIASSASGSAPHDSAEGIVYGLFYVFPNEVTHADISDRAANRFATSKVPEIRTGADDRLYVRRCNEQKALYASLLRDIIGNPFELVVYEKSWLAWQEGTVPKLAESIYDERAFDRMPILADALEEAGCSSNDILNHCRDPHANHVRGCWVLDLLLQKESKEENGK